MTAILMAALLACACLSVAQDSPNRWKLDPKGGIESEREFLTRGESHADHIEMSGRSVNAIVKWSIDAQGQLSLNRVVRWPMIREKKDDTHASLSVEFPSSKDPQVKWNGRPLSGTAAQFRINGSFAWTETSATFRVEKEIFPSTSLPCLIERWTITNTSSRPADLDLPLNPDIQIVSQDRLLNSAARVSSRTIPGGRTRLQPQESTTIGLIFSAVPEGEADIYPDIDAEWAARRTFVESQFNRLLLDTGDKEVDQLFAFSKLRASENVLATRGGLMHAPGGFNKYLAALWCNDQNEYVSPFFPFLADPAGNESARNAYKWFAQYMNPEYRHLPSSIVAEGRSTWQGAGDRGDAAMTAYGASRWALATGDRELAREVWPLIEWCLEYCERQKTADGVIASDSDELEGRFSSGKTNLATSSLTYDALISAAYLAEELGRPQETAKTYRTRANDLRAAIERVFGANVAGFETYRYHEGLDSLRSWICIPLVMDIDDRAEGTIDALFSPELWTKDGLLTAAGSKTYWDRSTLYALRGVFRTGHSKTAAEYLHRFAERRLLGDHVPYAIEAYPEQNASHLSAEAGLYCRIIIEGAVGIRPTGFNQFSMRPQLPPQWKHIKLSRIHAFGQEWDCQIVRKGKDLQVTIIAGGKVCYQKALPAGSDHQIRLP